MLVAQSTPGELPHRIMIDLSHAPEHRQVFRPLGKTVRRRLISARLGGAFLFVFFLPVMAGCGASRPELGEIVTDLPKVSEKPARPVEVVKPADSEPGATAEQTPAGSEPSPAEEAK